MRMRVWEMHIGNKLQGDCQCCKHEKISIANFECGHVQSVAHGGKNTLANLRPICSMCNRSMGAQNMDEYIALLGECESLRERIEEMAIKDEPEDAPAATSSSASSAPSTDDEVAPAATPATADEHAPTPAIEDETGDDMEVIEEATPSRSAYFNLPRAFMHDLAYDRDTQAQIHDCLAYVDPDSCRYTISKSKLHLMFCAYCTEHHAIIPSFDEFDKEVCGLLSSDDPISLSRAELLARCKEVAHRARGCVRDFLDYSTFRFSVAFIEDIARGALTRQLTAHCADFAMRVAPAILFELFTAWCKANGVFSAILAIATRDETHPVRYGKEDSVRLREYFSENAVDITSEKQEPLVLSRNVMQKIYA
jgi:hypothetical protein